MRRPFALLAAVIAVVSAAPVMAAEMAAVTPAVLKKLSDLGYPSDPQIAIQRWRADARRSESGALGAEESEALMAQPLPEFLAAMAGNPFTGLGLALRHKTREEAEVEAVKICKVQGGGATCANPMVVRADQCVAVVGYNVMIERRPTYRTSVAVSTDGKLSMDRANEGCQTGASHPALCRPLLSYCGDGREFQVFDDSKSADAATAAAPGSFKESSR